MKNQSVKLALLAAGCFFGAGFMSGQELWHFFGRFGIFGIPGLILSCALLSLLVGMTAYCSRFGDPKDSGRLLIPFDSKILHRSATISEAAFCFCIFTVMTAGASSLFPRSGNGSYAGLLFTAAFTVSAVIIASKGIGGAVKLFSLTVPVLGITAFLISAISIVKCCHGTFSLRSAVGYSNSISKFWPLSAFIYASYNFFCSVGAVSDEGRLCNKKKSIFFGTVICFFILVFVSSGLLVALFLTPEASSSDLPLIVLACKISPVFGKLCSILLLFAMLGASVGVLIPLFKFAEKIALFRNNKVLVSTFFAAASFILSKFGFKELISTVYPIFGCISAFGIFGLTVNFVKLHFKRHMEK